MQEFPLTGMQRIRHVLSRFAFGPTPALVAEVKAEGIDAWFEKQLRGKVPDPPFLQKKLRAMKTLGLSCGEILRTFRPRYGKKRKQLTKKERARLNKLRFLASREVKDWVLLQAVYGGDQVLETSCDFFRNHFNVYLNKGNVRFQAMPWERDVIRAEALGNFGRMLKKSARHPAMLYYLDNYLSRCPGNLRRPRGRRARGPRRKQPGLNENYGREILELHTLGADNYYTQKDVIQAARILTGWTVRFTPDNPSGFFFRKEWHWPGNKTFLGTTIPARPGNPIAEGEQFLEILARHPGTAHYLAKKLCSHFAADDPPEAMVVRVARVFLKTGGDLKSVYRAILKDPLFFSPRFYMGKVKRPFEFVVSALRVTGARVDSTFRVQRILKEMNEPVYECMDPTGYYDRADKWLDPGVLAGRWKFARDLAAGRIRGVRVPPSLYEGLHPKLPQAWPYQLAARILPDGLSDRTASALDRVMKKRSAKGAKPDPSKVGPELLALLLGSPEFQRQ